MGQSGDTVKCFGDVAGSYTPTATELSTQGLLAYRPYSISAGCDFLCTLTDGGTLGIYEHSSKQFSSYKSTWPSTSTLTLDTATGLDTSGKTYVQAACGTFAAYAIDSSGTLAAWGRVFSATVGPVLAGTDTTGTATSNTASNYLQRRASSLSFLSANSGFGHACAVNSLFGGECWGADYSSQVSRGNAVSAITVTNIYPPLRSSRPTSPTAAVTAAPTRTPSTAPVASPTSRAPTRTPTRAPTRAPTRFSATKGSDDGDTPTTTDPANLPAATNIKASSASTSSTTLCDWLIMGTTALLLRL